MSDKGDGGFTLLEVLVALVILSVGAAGLIGAVRQDLRQQAGLEQKTIAMWVAQNRMAELHAAHAWINQGTMTERSSMAGRDWALTITTAATPNPDMETVGIAVRKSSEAENANDAFLTGFIGRH